GHGAIVSRCVIGVAQEAEVEMLGQLASLFRRCHLRDQGIDPGGDLVVVPSRHLADPFALWLAVRSGKYRWNRTELPGVLIAGVLLFWASSNDEERRPCAMEPKRP